MKKYKDKIKNVFDMEEKEIKNSAKKFIGDVKKKLINTFMDNLDNKISANEGSGGTSKLVVINV